MHLYLAYDACRRNFPFSDWRMTVLSAFLRPLDAESSVEGLDWKAREEEPVVGPRHSDHG